MLSSTFPDKARHVAILLQLTRKKGLQIFGQNPIQHGLFGLARTIRLSAAGHTRASEIRRSVHGTTESACGLPSPSSTQTGTYGGRTSEVAENTTMFSAFSRENAETKPGVLALEPPCYHVLIKAKNFTSAAWVRRAALYCAVQSCIAIISVVSDIRNSAFKSDALAPPVFLDGTPRPYATTPEDVD